jgi:ubiquitin carboxyl-terminal hydrolase 8
MYLSLPIPKYNAAGTKGGPVYLEECIEKFTEEETLEGSDAWYLNPKLMKRNCPRCKCPRKSVKRLTIARLPIILIIHLKRFYFQGPFREKIETYVEFPLL